MPQFIDDNGESPMAYSSILVSPEKLSIFGSELCLKIVKELAKKPGCAMDLARKLEQHEQKIYYHLRNLDGAGIINQIRTEQRYGMTAKIYAVVSPVVATRLYNDGYPVENDAPMRNPAILKFLHPFIKDGKLNAKIIIGDPYPHGEYDKGGLDGCYVADLSLFFGNFVNELNLPCYKLDVRITEKDLKNNHLIVLGSCMGNVITSKLNGNMPVYFDDKNNAIVSRTTGNSYKDDLAGIIIRTKNPFNKNKQVLVIAGRRTRGTESAVIAFTRYTDVLIKNSKGTETATVIHGIDKDGDGIIDSVKFLE